MESDKINDIAPILSDPHIIDHPCVNYVQSLLYNVESDIGSDGGFVTDFAVYVITELEITKTIFWFYDKKLFEGLAWDCQIYLIDHSEKLSKKNQDALSECVFLLRHIAQNEDHLDSFPIEYDQMVEAVMCVRSDIWRRVDDKFRNPNVKCPSCSNEFSQVAFDVVRTPFAVKCPKCKQSISL